MPPKILNKSDFPSITGIDAAAPILPNPSTADPSLTTNTVLPFAV